MKLWNLTITFTGVILLFGGVSAFADESGKGVRVVSEWGTLRSQPAHEIDGGVKVKLGIEADVGPQWSSVLVYCLVEEADGKQFNKKLDHDNVIGPMDIEIEKVGAPKQLKSFMSMESAADPGKENQLFVRSVALTEVGEYSIKFFQRSDQKLIASATIKSVRDAYHPWMPFGRPTGKHGDEDDELITDFAATRSGGISLPAYDGIMPILSYGSEEVPTVGAKLPKAIPAEADPELKLTAETKGGGLILNLESDVAFIMAGADRHYLMRWWVNGKPFVPAEEIKDVEKEMEGFAIRFGKRQRIHIEFSPEHLGAESGDKVGLQLLYLLNGWEFVSPEPQMLSEMNDAEVSPLTRLSNKVEFVVP